MPVTSLVKVVLIFASFKFARSNLPQMCSLTTNPHSGIQLIHPQPGFREPFEVFCDQDYEGGGWIVVQNRYEGSVHFYRGWNDYERGFGNIEGEFWLGLSKIHELTYSRRNLNGRHMQGKDNAGIRWIAFRGSSEVLKKAHMMIRSIN